MSESSTSTSIIVSYKGANILTLPYKDNSVIKQFDFTPGNNKMSSGTWEKINISNKKRMSHYNKYLKLIIPEVEKTTSNKEDEVINPSDYNADKAIELIQGCMDLSELINMRSYEENSKDRITVISAIDAQEEEIKAFLKKVEDEKKG